MLSVSLAANKASAVSKKIPLYGEIVKDEFFTYKVLSHSRKQILRLEISKINNLLKKEFSNGLHALEIKFTY